jgi:hypothetical protein
MLCGMEGSKGQGRKQENVGHTVVPNAALPNFGFQLMRIVLLKVFAHTKKNNYEFRRVML